ncbi:MAG: spermidine synthase [Deltaproteobacteria bacterium]|nr:spermidine synthase [Deltaproteobacteria bacterium]
MTAMLAGIFFLSGAAGLLFETLWFRQAGLAFGNSFWASSLVLASFMAGLGLGNALVARLGARVREPLRAYAVLEVAIGAGGVAVVFGLPSLTPALVALLRPLLEQPWLVNPLRLVVGFVLLALPATAMGATLPLLVRVLAARDASFGSALGRLYGWNTLGAVVGCLIGEIALIERFGVRGTALVAAGANLVAAAGGLWLARRVVTGVEAATQSRTGVLTPAALRFLCAAGLSGAVLLALEVVWFRFMHLFTHSGAVAFSIMLAVVLSGIASGGLLAGFWLRRDPTGERNISLLSLAAGLLLIATYAGFRFALSEDDVYLRDFWRIAWLGALLMFPSSLLSGVVFTLLGAALQKELGGQTRSAGLLTLANTAGAALGSLVAGFALLPLLGIERSFALLAALYAGVAALAWKRRAGTVPRLPLAAAGLLLGGLVLFPFGLLRDDYLMRAVRPFADSDAVVAVREGRTETAVLLRHDFLGEPLDNQLVTDGYSMAGTRLDARRYMKLFVYWPVALSPDPKQALLISYGVGSTAQAMTDTASLVRIDIVDISREILGLAELVYPDANDNPLRDPRVQVHVEDGRYFLQTTQRRYDLITGEPPPPKAAGVESLYTREYFALVHDRLAEGGVTSYWLPIHSLSDRDTRAIVRGFCEVFADCSLWRGAGNNWMLVGSRDGLDGVSEEEMAAQWRDPIVGRDLRELGFERPEQLGAAFLADADQLAQFTRGELPLVDDFPKRLSDGLFTERGSAANLARWGADADAARSRFRDSAFIRGAWPAELRERSLGYFEHQNAVYQIMRGRWVPFDHLPRLHRVLQETDLVTLPMWLLGGDADRLRNAERVGERNPGDAEAQRTLGLAALARRDFAAASEALDVAWQAEPDDFSSLYWLVYALCSDQRCDEAMQLATAERERLPDAARDLIFWHWLRRAFGVEVPLGG